MKIKNYKHLINIQTQKIWKQNKYIKKGKMDDICKRFAPNLCFQLNTQGKTQ